MFGVFVTRCLDCVLESIICISLGLKSAGLGYHSVFTLSQVVSCWHDGILASWNSKSHWILQSCVFLLKHCATSWRTSRIHWETCIMELKMLGALQSRVYWRASLEDRGAMENLWWLSPLRQKMPVSVSSNVFLCLGPFLELVRNLKDPNGDGLHLVTPPRAHLACWCLNV